MLGPIIEDVDEITLDIGVGTELGSLDGYFDGYNDGNREGLLLGYSLVSTDGNTLELYLEM